MISATNGAGNGVGLLHASRKAIEKVKVAEKLASISLAMAEAGLSWRSNWEPDTYGCCSGAATAVRESAGRVGEAHTSQSDFVADYTERMSRVQKAFGEGSDDC